MKDVSIGLRRKKEKNSGILDLEWRVFDVVSVELRRKHVWSGLGDVWVSTQVGAVAIVHHFQRHA
jgi:hypothetical protein